MRRARVYSRITFVQAPSRAFDRYAAFALIFSATAHAGGTLTKDQTAIEKILKKAVCVCTSTLHRVGFSRLVRAVSSRSSGMSHASSGTTTTPGTSRAEKIAATS